MVLPYLDCGLNFYFHSITKNSIKMKKQNFKNLALNKKSISDLNTVGAKGGWSTLQLTWQEPSRSCFGDCNPNQTGSMCLTGNGTNCQ